MTALTDRMQIWDKDLMAMEDAKISDEELAEMLSEKLGNIDFIG